MVKVITYGTYDLLHYGHIKLLERAKALGDYLIVGITSDDFDMSRGKINVQQSLSERIEAVKNTGLADEIIIEEYEGQKIDDIKKYDIDIFTVGSDWRGTFDYLNEFCKVVYLERTQGISSSQIREKSNLLRLGMVGDSSFLNKVYEEVKYVNGLEVFSICTDNIEIMTEEVKCLEKVSFCKMLEISDAIYIRSKPERHYDQIKECILNGKHVLCESPITLEKDKTIELFNLANDHNVVLMEAIKTAYSTAFNRLVLLLKSGKIGDVVSIDTTCTSLDKSKTDWDGFYEWAPTAMLPIFELFGINFKCNINSYKNKGNRDLFTKVDFVFEKSVASIKVGDGVKSEGDMVISGTKGYVYVPAPWWKTDYFEIRYEDPKNNKRYFYQLEGEGIRYELVAFIKKVNDCSINLNVRYSTSVGIASVMEKHSALENQKV